MGREKSTSQVVAQHSLQVLQLLTNYGGGGGVAQTEGRPKTLIGSPTQYARGWFAFNGIIRRVYYPHPDIVPLLMKLRQSKIDVSSIDLWTHLGGSEHSSR